MTECNKCKHRFRENERKYFKMTDNKFMPYCKDCVNK